MWSLARRGLCRVFGHRRVPARPLDPMVIPTIGLVGGWRIVPVEEARGIACPRCGLYEEMEWVTLARELTGAEP